MQCIDGDTVNATTRFHQFNSIESTSVEIGDPMNTNDAIRGELEAKERKVSTKNLPTHMHLQYPRSDLILIKDQHFWIPVIPCFLGTPISAGIYFYPRHGRKGIETGSHRNTTSGRILTYLQSARYLTRGEPDPAS